MDPIASLANRQSLVQQVGSTPQRVNNAWRHGLCARQVTVREEEREDFEQLRDAMAEQWRPRNVSAWLLVDQLARLQWRLMRAGEAETQQLEDLQSHWKSTNWQGHKPERVSAEAAIARDVGGRDSGLMRMQLYQMRLERSVRQTIGLLIAMRKSRGKRGGLGRNEAGAGLTQVVV